MKTNNLATKWLVATKSGLAICYYKWLQFILKKQKGDESLVFTSESSERGWAKILVPYQEDIMSYIKLEY